MNVFYSLDTLPDFKNTVITIGSFDGVHIGHQKILQKVTELAKEQAAQSVVITFHPHPRLVLNPKDTSVQLLNSTEEKVALLHQYGIENVVVVPFPLILSTKRPKVTLSISSSAISNLNQLSLATTIALAQTVQVIFLI